jgi:hypothetical protein
MKSRPRALLPVLMCMLLAGCRAMAHPRYAPELENRMPDCRRIVVFSGTIQTEVKNYKTDDWFTSPAVGVHYGQLFAQSVGRVLRDRMKRDVRIEAEAAVALGGDGALARTVADRLLAHAREWMARDPGHESERLAGLSSDPRVVPEELRRNFDAVLVVGGRTKYESDPDRSARYLDIVARNAIAYPLVLLSPLFPPLLPISIATLAQGATGYWVGAPNVSYFSVALFDARTGRLLYVNDWFDTQKIDDEEGFADVARELLNPIVRVKGSETAPLGARPERWDP